MIGITGVVIAKNEAMDLPRALEQWSQVCDKGILVDDGSTDDTARLAEEYGFDVIETHMGEKGFASLRNLGLSAVETELALVFDADETPDKYLLDSVNQVKSSNTPGHFRIDRTNVVLGRPILHGRWGRDKQIRLMPPDTRYHGIVHEHPVVCDDIPVTDLAGTILHRPYKELDEYIQKMRAYANQNAERNLAEQHEIGLGYIVMRLGGNFVIRQGFRDGWRGLLLAIGDVWYDSLTLSEQHRQRANAKVPLITN
jgi:(heptosyl)LPS beta-1,4-glucosyltransferase